MNTHGSIFLLRCFVRWLRGIIMGQLEMSLKVLRILESLHTHGTQEALGEKTVHHRVFKNHRIYSINRPQLQVGSYFLLFKTKILLYK